MPAASSAEMLQSFGLQLAAATVEEIGVGVAGEGVFCDQQPDVAVATTRATEVIPNVKDR